MNKRQQGMEFYRKRAVWGCHEHAFTSHPPQLDEEDRCPFWLPTCSGTALEWPKSKLASLKGSVLPSARTKVRPRMRCCKKRGIIYTDGGEAPVMWEPSLEIIGMLVGSIACCANVEHLMQFSRSPSVFRDLTTIDLFTTPLATNSRATASPALCSRMPTGADNLVDHHTRPRQPEHSPAPTQGRRLA